MELSFVLVFYPQGFQLASHLRKILSHLSSYLSVQMYKQSTEGFINNISLR